MSRRDDPLADPEELVRRVYSYVAYVVGDGANAEDVTSAAIERAVRYRESYDKTKGPPIAWLLGIARRCVADLLGEPRTLPEEHIEDLAGTDDVALDNVDRLAVQAAVSQLGDRDRELVALRYGADLTSKQIGELLGVNANAVDVALHRVHARLRRELAREFGPGASP